MRIESVRIENFRSFEDETIPFNEYNCLVGANGVGKSNVLMALNLFFRQTENVSTDLAQLNQEDFHRKNTTKPSRVTVTFCDLSEEAKTDFSNYVRLDRLIVTAEAIFIEEKGVAEVKQFGQRLVKTEFKEFFEAVEKKAKVAELKQLYEGLQKQYAQLPPAGPKDSMINALREYESDRPEECELIPSEDQFYGFSRGANRLAKHIQWIYVPAVKDVIDEEVESKSSALGKLLQRTVRTKTNFEDSINALRKDTQESYQELLQGQQAELDELSSLLQNGIKSWAHPDAWLRLEWKEDPLKSVQVVPPLAHVIASEGDFEGSLARFGHGLQRSYLLALLQELARTDDDTAPTLVLACEEPELHQHPPQARHLARVLTTLSLGNTQVIVTAHDPRFVSGQGFEDVRKIYRDVNRKCSKVSHMSFDEIAQGVSMATGHPDVKPEEVLAKVHQALQPALNEMFFADRLILVEGLEDLAYIESYLRLLEKDDEFRQMGGHIVLTNGKSEMLRPLVIAKHMDISTYLVVDADADKPDKNGSSKKHENDNRAILKLLGKSNMDPMPDSNISCSGFTMWHSDITTVVEADIGSEAWKKYQSMAAKKYGFASGLKKNMLHIGASLAFAWRDGIVSSELQQVCEAILDPQNVIPN